MSFNVRTEVPFSYSKNALPDDKWMVQRINDSFSCQSEIN